MALDSFLGFLCYVLGTKLGGVLLLRMCHKAMPFVIWRVGWPQDVANMRKKLKSLSFSRVSEVALGHLFRVPLLRFGHEIRFVLCRCACATKPCPLWFGGLVGRKIWQTCVTSWKVLVLGGLVGRKMWQTCVTSWKVSALVGFQKWR